MTFAADVLLGRHMLDLMPRIGEPSSQLRLKGMSREVVQDNEHVLAARAQPVVDPAVGLLQTVMQ